MARPLRLEISGALYHVTARGNERHDIFLQNTDEDRRTFLDILNRTSQRCTWLCHAYCLMTNHYHLLIETPDANLSKGMRQLNGVYTQRINRAYGRVGHLFQGRYKAIFVEKDSYLLELALYVVLNPVRARMVPKHQDWPWSSYFATVGMAATPRFLNTDWLLRAFSDNRKQAVAAYQRFVAEVVHTSSPWQDLKNQVFLGSDAFVERMQASIGSDHAPKRSAATTTESSSKTASLLSRTLCRPESSHRRSIPYWSLQHASDR